LGLEALFSTGYSGFFLGFARISGLFITAPVFQVKAIPPTVRIFFAIVFAIVLAPFVRFDRDLLQLNMWMAGFLMLQELLVGMIIGFVVNMTFYALHIAGHFIDVAMGFSMVNVLDPATGQNVPVLGQFSNILAILIFLAINGHHTMIMVLVKSFELIKPGLFFLKKAAAGVFIQAFSRMFLFGFQISIPVLGTIFLTDIALGIIAKLIPQINVFVVGFGVKILVGILILVLFVPVYVILLENTFAGTGDTFKMLRLMMRQLTL
jgi:flagellar biosynthetic protein FliR